jgi:phage gpG-like protein
MGLTFTDTFGPFLLKAVGFEKDLDKATEKNAFLLQANIVKGIRNQVYKSQWPDLKEATKKAKQRKNLSSLILVATGDLSSSFEVVPEGSKIFHVGTNNPYARVHEFGYAPRKIPARPYFRPAQITSEPAMRENWKEAFVKIIKN